MWVARITIRWLAARLALAWIAALALAFPAQAETWPTTEFVFENTDPDAIIPASLNPFSGFDEDEKPIIADYEAYLTRVAQYYESLGFRSPPLPLTEGRNGGRAYRVYAFDFKQKETTARAGFGGVGKVDLRFDISRAIVGGRPVPRSYEDLAHELFHNVQRGYQTSDEAEHGLWIMEGQAQAMGMEAAKRLRGIDAWADFESYRLGGRSYQISLATEVHDLTYRTASFWRYLAEHTAAARRNRRAGVDPADSDYSYLAKLYATPFRGPASQTRDLEWLDAGLRTATGLDLDRLYADFVATFAGYVPARLIKPPASTDRAVETWLNYVYGTCPTIALSPKAPSTSLPVTIDAVAAGCFKVDIAGIGPTSLTIQTRADTVQKLWALRIGTSGGDQVKSPRYLASPAGGGYIGQWRFDIQAGVPQVFVISNVAEKAERSALSSLSLDFTGGHWGSSLTVPQPESARRSEGIADGRRDRPAQPPAAAVAPGARPVMTNQTALGARAVFERDRPSCGESFAVAGCGPRTTIRLSLVPGAIGDLTQGNGTGGITGQFIGEMSAGARAGIESELMESWRAIERTEGSSVHIVVPAIEYGFTGTLDNASITVSGGEDHGTYQALGPEDSSPGGDRVFLQSGRVTIEEFTPFVMRGHFDAQLTDMSQVKFSPDDVDQPLPIHRTINGSFVIASPWEGDPQVQVYQAASDASDAALQDLMEAFPVLGTMDLSDVAPPAAAPAGMSFPTSAVGAFPACDCSCEAVESQTTGPCISVCLVVVQQAEERAARQAALTAGRREQSSLANAVGLIAARGALSEADVSTEDLLIAALRMRPDRIILGELRGHEAFTFLRAVNTGHPGSMTTIHADTPQRAIEQLSLLVLQTGSRLSRDDVRKYVRQSIDLFVQLERRDGRRRVSQVLARV